MLPTVLSNNNKGSIIKKESHRVVIRHTHILKLCYGPRVYKTVYTRPYTEAGIRAFGNWVENYRWLKVYTSSDAHKKAQIFQQTLMQAYEEYFPIKSFKISNDDCPWMTKSLKKLDRLRKREFYKNEKSLRWENLNRALINQSQGRKRKLLH